MVIRSDFDKQLKISESLAEHRLLIDAWKRGDRAAAAAALERHLSRAEARVMENFAQILNDLEAEQEPPPRQAANTRSRT
jgi:DNA-binding GntR family transcriptional regulator